MRRRRARSRIRGREIALVPQSPLAALNPALRLETQIREAAGLGGAMGGGETARRRSRSRQAIRSRPPNRIWPRNPAAAHFEQAEDTNSCCGVVPRSEERRVGKECR